jgi:hypothetical protein
MLTTASRLRLAPRLLVLCGLLYAFVWITGYPQHYDDDELPPDAQRARPVPTARPFNVEVDQVVVGIQTTATEVWAKIPSTLLFMYPHNYDSVILLGDLHMEVGVFHVHDVLDRFDDGIRGTSPDMERYRRQLTYASQSRDLSLLVEQDQGKEKDIRTRLSKYKILRTLERTWQHLPERNWYVFVDVDTYLIRSNMLSWLGQYDSALPVFFGNPPQPDIPNPFGFGGSTFVLSAAAMRSLLIDHEEQFQSWDKRLADFSTAWDALTSAVSAAIQLTPNRTSPALSGFNPRTAPYGPGTWCEEVVALQSITPDLASELWRLQTSRDEAEHVYGPLTFADLWERFVQPENLLDARDDWDNLYSGPENARWNMLFDGVPHASHATEHTRHSSRDEEARATSGEASWEACRESCNGNERCMQWSYSSTPTSNYNENRETKCHLSRSLRFGRHRGVEAIIESGDRKLRTWKSGWRRDRFDQWTQHQRCKSQQN